MHTYSPTDKPCSAGDKFIYFTKYKVVKLARTQTRVSFLINSHQSLSLSVNSTAAGEAGSQASCVTCVSLLCLQGMNFIVGYLLIVTRDEEKSFWLLEALLGRILPGDLCSHPRRSPGHICFKPVEHFFFFKFRYSVLGQDNGRKTGRQLL